MESLCGFQNFSCLTESKSFVADSFSVSLIPILIKVRDKTGLVGFTIFRRFFCLTVRKYFAGEPFCVLENFWYREKFLSKRGISSISVEILLLKVPKIFVGQHICVSQNFLYRKKLWMRGEGE